MSLTKIALVACGLTMALATSAFAQESRMSFDLKDRMAIIVMPTGEAKLMKVTDTGHAVVMKEATALPAGTIILRSGGKLYVMHDKQLPNKKMFFDNTGVWLAQP